MLPDDAPILAALAACLVSGALQWTNGMYRPKAVWLVAFAWIVALVAALGRTRFTARFGKRSLTAVLGLVIGVHLALMATEAPTIEMVVHDEARLHVFRLLLVVVALLTGIGLGSRSRRVEALWFPTVVAIHAVMGSLVIGFVPSPKIDVWTVEMESLQALLGGRNPYAISLSDPYGGASGYFPPGLSQGGRLPFGFVYPPAVLFACVPGYLLGGDPRWSTLAAMGLAALLMGYARPGRIAKLAAVAFLFMPRTFFVMDRSWSDPFVVLATAAVAYAAVKRSRFLFVAIGLYICLKQHMFIGVPALFLLLPRPIAWRRAIAFAIWSVAVALVITLPLALCDWHAFAKSVLDIREVYRTDSLGFVAYLHNTGTATLSKWVGLLAIAPVAALGLLRAPRGAGAFALVAGVTHFTLYVWSTHAFCNEYYNVVGSLCCAVAVWGSPARELPA